jgi:AcrR family transcriptional regulator
MNSVSPADKTATRDRYHHGDLRNALIAAAVELARTGGPEAVVLREVTRRVGVTAPAAYRHFGTYLDLLKEVKLRVLAELGVAIVEELGRLPADGDPGDLAEARLEAVLAGYLHFAAAQPGLFNMAFYPLGDAEVLVDPAEAENYFREADAYVMLGALLDDLVAVGRMNPARRPGAEIAAWSAVHGLAVLLQSGPLRHLPAEEQAVGRERTVRTVVEGLTRPVD